ncbi:MAG: NMT1/THI5 like protein [candidate division BRC1 bacterium ADurb.BinA364]|nr:MAG: NMT1/THI5 like protein [candidate division BRC1 bacterium ADurb.BinA364]
MEFGIAQSDRQYEAVNGIAEWAKLGPQTNLRAVFSIHNESVTLVASEESGIRSLHDLKGKRVNIGSPGTGGRQNAIDVLQAAGIDYEKDMKAESVKAGDAPDLLRDSRIDAFFYTVGHPNGTIKEATAGKRKAVIVPIDGIGNLIDTHPYYAPAEIDLSHYEQAANAADGKTPTFAVKAVLLTSAQVPDDIVYAITKEVFDNLEQFKTLHEAFADLTREGMLLGLTAPIHPGAMRYFKESGLMQ